MNVEEEYLDVLNTMESAIIQIYRETPDLIDAEVQTAIEALIRIYGAEAQSKSISTRPLKGVAKQVMVSLQSACEWLLGREAGIDAKKGEMNSEPNTVDEIVICLKRIQSSIKFWTQKGGRQGYLNFVKPYIR